MSRDEDEIKALLAAPDRTTWIARRDHALAFAIHTVSMSP